jgi:ribosome-binding protein aMBF1 (putative translation factor)
MNSSSTRHSEFSQSVATLIIGAMADVGISFEALATKLALSVEVLREIIYGDNSDITVHQLTSILSALDYKLIFSSNRHPDQKKLKHLKLVVNNTVF